LYIYTDQNLLAAKERKERRENLKLTDMMSGFFFVFFCGQTE